MAKLVVAKLPELIQTAGSFGSINFTPLTCDVAQQTKFGVSSTTTSFDAPISVTTFDGTYQTYDLFDAVDVSRAVMSLGGHELAIQGPIAPLQIKLDNSTGNVGDMIVRTVDGPRWQPDYYSTYFNIMDAPTLNIGEGGTVWTIDPRNGFTQYAGMSLDGTTVTLPSYSRFRFAFVKGLPTGRVWRVRVHVYVDTTVQFNHTFVDPNFDRGLAAYGSLKSVGAGSCSQPEDADLYGGSSHLYEFFTYNGGGIWYWTKLVGFQSC